MVEGSKTKILNAMSLWMIDRKGDAKWTQWQHERFAYVFNYDKDHVVGMVKSEKNFSFGSEIDDQHQFFMMFIYIMDCVEGMKECEYYFRRYPFRGLDVARHRHISNTCEMYFSRVYQLKARIKNLSKIVNKRNPACQSYFGNLVKLFDKAFDLEMRERNKIHHHMRYEDVETERVYLLKVVSDSHPEKGWDGESLIAYRRVAKDWAARVRQRSERADLFVEAIAQFCLENCDFLLVLAKSGKRGIPPV
jgi:hypothetical protein